MNNEVLHDITIIRTSLPVYSIQQAAEQQAFIFLCRVFKVTFVTSRLEIYLCKPPILQFCFKAHAIVFGGSLHTHVLSILLLKILTLCLSNKKLSFPHIFFRLKKNIRSLHPQVDGYSHQTPLKQSTQPIKCHTALQRLQLHQKIKKEPTSFNHASSLLLNFHPNWLKISVTMISCPQKFSFKVILSSSLDSSGHLVQYVPLKMTCKKELGLVLFFLADRFGSFEHYIISTQLNSPKRADAPIRA